MSHLFLRLINHNPPNTSNVNPANPPNTPPTIAPTFFPVPPVVLGWFVCNDAGKTVLTIYCVDTCPLFGFVTITTLVVVDASEGREEEVEMVLLLHELLRNVVVWVERMSIVEVPMVVSVVVPPGIVLVTVVTTGEHAAALAEPPAPAEQGWVLVIVVTPGDKVDTTVDVNVEKLCDVATVVCVASEVEHAAAIFWFV